MINLRTAFFAVAFALVIGMFLGVWAQEWKVCP